MQPGAAQQQIVDKIQKSTNILVAVNANPSVDSLAAALGLALLLNKLDKHATAVFSGAIPPAINFLEPNKTFESNVNGLRDFIISLDKDKADRLRYKVEEDVVRIFITPYRTTITQDDFKFSQGDFNVELIIALGVEKREDLDAAIVAHGRILHDATVVTINANNQQSGLGTVDWHDPNASSLCEMIIGLSDKMQKPGLVDAQISTALLTGLVAATERFSNQHTTPAVMTMAAQMMAAGANQQLVATNLQPQRPLPEVSQPAEVAAAGNGELSIAHAEQKPAKRTQDLAVAEKELEAALPKTAAPSEPNLDELKQAIKEETKQAAGPTHEFLTEAPEDEAESQTLGEKSWRDRRLEPPTMGSPFSATTAQALTDKNFAEEEERKFRDKVSTLKHGEVPTEAKDEEVTPPAEEIAAPAIVESAAAAEPVAVEATVNEPAVEHAPMIGSEEVIEEAPQPQVPQETTPAQEPAEQAPPEPVAAPAPTLAELEQNARKDLEQAYAAQPFNPAGQPREDVGAQESLQVQPFEQQAPQTAVAEEPVVQPAPAVAPIEQPAAEPFAVAPTEPAPVTPPQPVTTDLTPNQPSGFGALPPIPPMPQLPISEPGQPGAPAMPPMPPALPELPSNPQMPPTPPSAFDANASNLPPAPVDPGQFKIPGQ
ncbi:MAG TPA: hypothetical protein VLA77_00420 [Candidatus Saccharimonadales bacterium]|nr:hypothetical protein [Candidatus Saccharimonadales bacterium]